MAAITSRQRRDNRRIARALQYHYDMLQMRRVLTIVDQALSGEGVASATRERICWTILCGSPNATEAAARVSAHQAEAARLMDVAFEPFAILQLPNPPEGLRP